MATPTSAADWNKRLRRATQMVVAAMKEGGTNRLSLASTTGAPPAEPKQATPPDTVHVVAHGSIVEIRRQWFNSGGLYVGRPLTWAVSTSIGCCCILFLLGFLIVPIAMPNVSDLLFFFVLLTLAGFWVTYIVPATFLNWTTVRIDGGYIHVLHGPFPWLGNRDISIAELKEVYVKETVSDEGPSTFEVRALTQRGRDIKLVGGPGLTRHEAFYIKHSIEKYALIPLPESRALPTGPVARRGRIFASLIAVAVVGGFGVVLAYAYLTDRVGPDRVPPLIQAE